MNLQNDDLLLEALQQEITIFTKFNSNQKLANYWCFHSPDTEQIPHWNLAYPTNKSTLINPDLHNTELLNYFSANNKKGHLATNNRIYAATAAETSEYFSFSAQDILKLQPMSREVSTETDLELFTATIQDAFNFTSQTRDYFKRKMETLSKQVRSQFYTVKIGAEVIGCCSTFETSDGSDFLFNVATLEKHRGEGVAKSVIQAAITNSKKRVFTYSHNPVMRERILPELCFKSLGTLLVVPLA